MTYEEDGLRLDDGALHALMARAAAEGLQVVLHAENHEIIDRLRREAVAAGNLAPRFHALTRPPVTEIDAIGRAIAFSRDTGCAVHILHLCAAGALPLVAAARAEGLPVTAETCTHFLALTDAALERPDAPHFVLSPPLRSAANQARLWQALRDGPLTAVTSDEVSYSAAAKTIGIDCFADIANGCPGVEARLPVLFTLGVAEGRIGLARFADLFATLPARMFGLGDRKGRIAPGMDADLVVIDPATRRRLTASDHYGPIGYSPYEGMDLTGWPVATVARGAVVVRDGAWLGDPGRGRFLPRGAPDPLPERR
jgi:dihydropyrimidinase